jgi:transposase
MIERHWVVIAVCCKPGNKVALRFVEELKIMIRIVQRRAYGSRDDEYLGLKIRTCTLPPTSSQK